MKFKLVGRAVSSSVSCSCHTADYDVDSVVANPVVNSALRGGV